MSISSWERDWWREWVVSNAWLNCSSKSFFFSPLLRVLKWLCGLLPLQRASVRASACERWGLSGLRESSASNERRTLGLAFWRRFCPLFALGILCFVRRIPPSWRISGQVNPTASHVFLSPLSLRNCFLRGYIDKWSCVSFTSHWWSV